MNGYRTFLESTLNTVGFIFVFIAIQFRFGDFIKDNFLVFIVIGLALAYFAKTIAQRV